MNCSVKCKSQALVLIMKNFIIFLFLLAYSASAEIYKWTDADGKVHFGDNPNKNAAAKAVKVEINTYTNVSYESVESDNLDKSADNNAAPIAKKVIMYSTSWCGYCKKARKYFIEKNINFVDYDIERDKNAKRAYDAMGAKGVPVILVGKKRMNGFSVEGFNNLLSAN